MKPNLDEWDGSMTNVRKILLVGDDESLLITRALLLSEWNTLAVNSKGAPEALKKPCDLMVLCQTVPLLNALTIIDLAKRLHPSPIMFALRFPEDSQQLGVKVHLVNSHDNPGWFRERVAELLG